MKDFNLSSDSIFINDEKELIIQQIDMLFDTIPTEVLGEYEYGADFYQFLWDLKSSNRDISEYTYRLITNNVKLFGWNLSVDTKILEGTENDIILIIIELKKDFDTFEKTYRVG